MLKTDLRHYKKFLYHDDENSPVLLSMSAAIAQSEKKLIFYTWNDAVADNVKLTKSFIEVRTSDVCGKEWNSPIEHWRKLHEFHFKNDYLPEFIQLGYFKRGDTSPKEIDYPTFYFSTGKLYFIHAWNIEEILGTKLRTNGHTLSDKWESRRQKEILALKEFYEKQKLEQMEKEKYKGLLEIQFDLEDLLNQQFLPYLKIDAIELKKYFDKKLEIYQYCKQLETCQNILAECVKKFSNDKRIL